MPIQIKKGVNLEDILALHPNLIVLIGFYSAFCANHKLPCKITSLITDVVKGRVSRTHERGLAADCSVNGWPQDIIDEFVIQTNTKFYNIAAISASDNVPRACIYHDSGLGKHLHLQVKAKGEFYGD